jgi:hypothetical protein
MAHLSSTSIYGIFNWPGRPTIEEVKGDFDCVTNIAARKFPTGPAGNIAGHRPIFHGHCGKGKRTGKPHSLGISSSA